MSLQDVDWSELPMPEDDGGAEQLIGRHLPSVKLASTAGGDVALPLLEGITVIYAYPMTGRPDTPLPDGWDMIPGARGCTPQSCAFRDHFAELKELGVSNLFGLSTQDNAYQAEAAERLHLPFPLLSDVDLVLTVALKLPSFEVDGKRLLRRLTMIIEDDKIVHVRYPVFPPDEDAGHVMNWLKARQSN
ncbi:MAG: peroxiredoxin [Pseudomonadota bacterium]